MASIVPCMSATIILSSPHIITGATQYRRCHTSYAHQQSTTLICQLRSIFTRTDGHLPQKNDYVWNVSGAKKHQTGKLPRIFCAATNGAGATREDIVALTRTPHSGSGADLTLTTRLSKQLIVEFFHPPHVPNRKRIRYDYISGIGGVKKKVNIRISK